MPRELGLSPGGQGETRQESWRAWGLESFSLLRGVPRPRTEVGGISLQAIHLVCSPEQGQPASIDCSDFHIIAGAGAGED